LEGGPGGGVVVGRNRVGDVEEEHPDDGAERRLDRCGLFGIAEMLVNCESEKFLKDDGGTRDIEVAAEKAFLMRGADLMREILEGPVRRAVEESLPVLELDVVDMGDKLPDIDLLPFAGLFDHFLETGKRQNAPVEGVDDIILVVPHPRLERLKAACVGRGQPDERSEIDVHVESSG
jgi:hypothetical protein